MDAALASAAMRKPIEGETVHYVSEPGTCEPVQIATVDQGDDIFLDLDAPDGASLHRIMLDSRFGYWDCDFHSYRRETWHWPDGCRHQ